MVNDAIQLPGFFCCVQRCKFSSTMLSIFLVDQNTYITATTYIYGQRVFYWAYFNAYSSKTICLSLRFIICWFSSWFEDKSYQVEYSWGHLGSIWKFLKMAQLNGRSPAFDIRAWSGLPELENSTGFSNFSKSEPKKNPSLKIA